MKATFDSLGKGQRRGLHPFRWLFLLFFVSTGALVSRCYEPPSPIDRPCEKNDDCGGKAQCIKQTCQIACQSDEDCGKKAKCNEGYCRLRCAESKECVGEAKCLSGLCRMKICQNGEQQPCYTGPAGSSGKGLCKEGLQTCNNGLWGECYGQMTPVQEICNGKDEDCDGQVDDNAPCPKGQLCYKNSCQDCARIQPREKKCDDLFGVCRNDADCPKCLCHYECYCKSKDSLGFCERKACRPPR